MGLSRSKKNRLKEEGQKVIEEVNRQLEEFGNPEGHERRWVGLNENGEWELLGIDIPESRMAPNGQCSWVLYHVRSPFQKSSYEKMDDRGFTTYRVRHQNGYVSVVVVNRKYVLLRFSHQFPAQKWQLSFFRGYSKTHEEGEEQFKELTQNSKYSSVFEIASRGSHKYLGDCFHDSAVEASRIKIYACYLEIEEEKLQVLLDSITSRDPIKLKLLSLEDFLKAVAAGDLQDGPDQFSWRLVLKELCQEFPELKSLAIELFL